MEYKTMEEYLMLLSEELKYLKPEDSKKVLDFYFNKISNAVDYGTPIEKVLANLPTPEEAAENAYASHGEKYLEKRRKHIKFKNKVNNIIDLIIAALLVFLFGWIMVFVGKLVYNDILLTINLFKVTKIIDKLIMGLSGICITLSLIIIIIYLIDLFYFMVMFFVTRAIDFKNKDKIRKLSSFTINGKINEVVKTSKFNFKLLLAFMGIAVICMIGSYFLKGYTYRSLNDVTTNTTTLYEAEYSSITINGENYKVNVYSTDKTSYIEYGYEFEHKVEVIENNDDTLTINIPNNTAYDFLDLLNEPTQVINLYVSDKKEININSTEKVEVIIKDTKVQSIIGTCTAADVSIYNSQVSIVNIDSTKLNLGISKSRVSKLEYKSTSGQFIVEEDSSIYMLTANNGSGTIKISDLTSVYFDLTNTAGTVNISDFDAENVTLNLSTSQNNFVNSNIYNVELNTSKVAYVMFQDSSIDYLIVTHKGGSYLNTYNLVNEEMTIDSEASYIFLDGVESDSTTVKYSGTTSKTEITNSKFSNLSINQSKGYLDIETTNIETGEIRTENATNIELSDNTGNQVDLYLVQVGNGESTGYIEIKSTNPSTLVYKIKLWDAASAANLVKDDNVIVDSEGVNEDE